MKSNAFIRLAVLLTILAGFTDVVHAGSIGVDFNSNIASTDQPGIVAGANWNDYFAISTLLLDDSGTPTTASVSVNSGGFYGGNSELSTPNAATNQLYIVGLFGDPSTVGEASITVTNVPYANYLVYAYSSQDTGATYPLSITDGTTTYYYESNGNFNTGATSLLLTTSTDPGNPTVGQAQYQIFSENSSSFTLTTGGSADGAISANIFGLQIVEEAPASAPEPGSFLTLGAGLVLVGLLARRVSAAA
jgi:hypothetical protein